MRDVRIDYLSKDYEAFRNDMINQIPRFFGEWTDHSSSDAGIVLLELFAYGLDILSYYQDRIANETYLPTATQLQSVIDFSRLIGYNLKNAQPSKTKVVFEITPHETQDFIIPAGFPISTKPTELEPAVIFETDSTLVIPAGNTGLEVDEKGEYYFSVSVTQGISVKNDIIGSSTGQPNQKIRLTYPNVIDNTLNLYVNEGGGFQLWTDVTRELVQDTDDKRHYWTEIDSDGYTWIVFGSGLDGKIPPEGLNNLQAFYRVGGGSETNVGANTITVLVSPLSGIKAVFNPISAKGGEDRETIEEVKMNAPRSLRTTNRAVTKYDYEVISLRIPGVLKAHAKTDINIGNLVHVYLVYKDNFDKDSVKLDVFNLLEDLKTITTKVSVEEAHFIPVSLKITANIGEIYQNPTLKTLIEETLTDRLAPRNREFGKGELLFQIYSSIGGINGIENISIDRMTIIPQPVPHTVSGEAEWSEIKVNETNTLRGKWKVEMVSTTNFVVNFSEKGKFDGSEILKGEGQINLEFTSTGGEITFTINGGANILSEGDYWTFETSPYKGDIIIQPHEFLTLGKLEVEVIGGVA